MANSYSWCSSAFSWLISYLASSENYWPESARAVAYSTMFSA